MSDLTIVEITDSSLNINKPDLILEDNNKRKLSSDDELEDSMAEKKICRDIENFVSIKDIIDCINCINLFIFYYNLRMIQA